MKTYRNASSRRLWVRRAGVVVDPGEEFDTDVEITDTVNFEEVKGKRKPAAPAEED